VKELEKLIIKWSLVLSNEEIAIKRYCHNCGKVTLFKDSIVRRHNANGKMIHQYAIYKCEKDHTWNQKLSINKAYIQEMDSFEEKEIIHCSPEVIFLTELRQKGIVEIEILLESVQGKWRLDKLLSQRLYGISRTEIVKWIKQSHILVDGVKVKSGVFVHEGQRVWIDLSEINF
jgi:hypothetical protein